MNDTEIRTLFEEALGDDMPTYPTPDEDVARGRRFRRRRHQHRMFAGLATIAAATALALSFVLIVAPGEDGREHAASQEELLWADRHPKILLNHPDWATQHAEVHESGSWIRYARGDDFARLSWAKIGDEALEQTVLENLREQGVPESPTTVAGNDATIFEPEDGFYQLVWWQDDTEITFGGEFDAVDDLAELARALEPVSDEDWRAAMSQATRTFQHTEAIEEIVADVPVVDTFWRSIEAEVEWIAPEDEQQLTQEVLHWVACGWVRQRLAGYENQDSAYVDDQLAEVLEWAQEHDVVTDEAVWDYTEAIVSGAETVNGRPLYDLFYAAKALRCGGW